MKNIKINDIIKLVLVGTLIAAAWVGKVEVGYAAGTIFLILLLL